jgi:hypothetical protein
VIQGGAATAGLCLAASAGAQDLLFAPNVLTPANSGTAFGAAPAVNATPPQPTVNPALLARAKAALQYHGASVPYKDVVGIADFSMASRDPRFYLVSIEKGWVTEHHVAHGRGSDPDHSGWLERFSNEVGSEASSNGAFVTGNLYYGKHGLSMRLDGLDPSNNNALDRAIVVHGAWYAEPKLIDSFGKLGRSQGCFAFSEENLQYILAQLGPGRMIYADKLAA